jgi:hypothetical protein
MDKAHGISSPRMAEPWKKGYSPATAGADKAPDMKEPSKPLAIRYLE